MSGGRGVLIAFVIGALGWGVTYVASGGASGSGIGLEELLLLAVATGFVTAWFTLGRAPVVGLIVGYGGAWAGYIWYYATFVGFREFDALIMSIAVLLVVLAAGAFAVGRLARGVVSRRAPR